jgi:AcrR family transcriptional regulator
MSVLLPGKYEGRHTISKVPRPRDTRQKMIRSAALLIRERGVQGTSFADVL